MTAQIIIIFTLWVTQKNVYYIYWRYRIYLSKTRNRGGVIEDSHARTCSHSYIWLAKRDDDTTHLIDRCARRGNKESKINFSTYYWPVRGPSHAHILTDQPIAANGPSHRRFRSISGRCEDVRSNGGLTAAFVLPSGLSLPRKCGQRPAGGVGHANFDREFYGRKPLRFRSLIRHPIFPRNQSFSYVCSLVLDGMAIRVRGRTRRDVRLTLH
jgi:hypothetical protein